MKNLPLVSVAIITYNQKEYLKECIESILEQDYNNIEIVVADDCSTDGTQEMLKEYEKNYPNKFILKLSEKNQGITKNSNLAHFACSGKYIAWMGGDDLMLPGKIIKQVEYMESHNKCAILHHDLDVFDSNTNRTISYLSHQQKRLSGTQKEVIKFGTFMGATSCMVRRDRTPENGFNEEIKIASDWLYWVDSLKDGYTIDYINEVLGRYRKHISNVTTIRKFDTIYDHIKSISIMLYKYPQHTHELQYRLATLLYQLRNKSKDEYYFYVKSSLIIKFNPLKFINLIVYLLSNKKICR